MFTFTYLFVIILSVMLTKGRTFWVVVDHVEDTQQATVLEQSNIAQLNRRSLNQYNERVI